MAKQSTSVNCPTPFGLSDAAQEVGCNPATLRKYVVDGVVDAQRTGSGRYVFFEPQIEEARRYFQTADRRRYNR